MATSDLMEFERKFRQRELLVAECGTWNLSVRPAQLTLGSMVLAAASGALSMAELSARERDDMGRGFALAERLAKQAFGANRINYLCLMMQDPIVHFHVLPRYADPLERFGVRWRDADWPGPPHVVPVSTGDDTLRRIRDALLEAL